MEYHGRARLYEVIQKVDGINRYRKSRIGNKEFKGKSYDDIELKNNPNLELDYIVAVPRMNLYKKYSENIYKIYMKYFSEEDIFVYSIDEVFIDVTPYLKKYKMDAKELTTMVIQDIFRTAGIS